MNNASNASGNWNNDVEIDCLSAEQIQIIWDIVLNSHPNCFSWDESAHNIITEEAAYYFQNQYDLDIVMSHIQNRMELYKAEIQ